MPTRDRAVSGLPKAESGGGDQEDWVVPGTTHALISSTTAVKRAEGIVLADGTPGAAVITQEEELGT